MDCTQTSGPRSSPLNDTGLPCLVMLSGRGSRICTQSSRKIGAVCADKANKPQTALIAQTDFSVQRVLIKGC